MVRAAIFNLSVTLLDTLGEASDRSNAAVHYTRSAAANPSVRSMDAALVLCIALGAMRGVEPLVRANAVVFVLCIALAQCEGMIRPCGRWLSCLCCALMPAQ